MDYKVFADSLVKEIGKIQEQIEYVNYSHFEDIRKLCDKNQIEKFNELINELTRLFSPMTMKDNEKRK